MGSCGQLVSMVPPVSLGLLSGPLECACSLGLPAQACLSGRALFQERGVKQPGRLGSHSPSPGKDSQLSQHGCFHSGLQVAALANRTQSSSEAARSLPSLRSTTPGYLMRPSGTLVLPRQMCPAGQARQC